MGVNIGLTANRPWRYPWIVKGQGCPILMEGELSHLTGHLTSRMSSPSSLKNKNIIKKQSMNKILVEGKYGHGAILHSPAKHKKIHQSRQFVGQDSSPYDWTQSLTRNYTQPIKNQYQAGMCGGELYSQAMQIFRTLSLGLPFQELSEISVYSQEHYEPDGMSVQQMEDIASFKGLTTFSNVPTPVNCTEAQAQSTSWENANTLKDCLLDSGMMMVSVPINIDSIAQAIRDYYFVGFCLGGTNNGSWLSAYPIAPIAGSIPQWGHFMCSTTNIPANPTVKQVPFYQSWGEEVGDKGIQYFTESYIDSGFIYDAFTFIKHTFQQNLQFGMINQDVKYLQVKLGMASNTFGFGVFGPKTLVAVKAYQAANGIQATGFVGIETRAALNKI